MKSNGDSFGSDGQVPGFGAALTNPAPAAQVCDVGELLAHALADDLDAAFENVVRTYQDRIVSFAARALRDRGRAEEVAQDVFVRAYRALQGYDRPRIRALRLRSWIYTIAANLVRNAARGKQLSVVGLEREDGRSRAIADPSPSAESRLELQDDWRRIDDAIALLSPKLRGAFVLRYVEDLTYDEVAETLGQPIGTVKANAHRGLIAVRAALENDDERSTQPLS
ncbi:MAG: RNA polymerase sigma factor [Candidatus Eremiobacteraeota bacterium]|nr:RNA polymerase sigma factor [Candidatus Eremiobacteraeota bacterium]